MRSVHIARDAVTNAVLLPGRFPSSYSAETYPKNLHWLRTIPTHSQRAYDFPFLYFQADKQDLLVILAHGNGCDIGDYKAHIANFQACNVSVLLWEYPGYGISPGKRTISGVNQHTSRVVEYATKELKWSTEDIVIYGHSIGSGPAMEMHTKLSDGKTPSVAGIILQSPYTSTSAIGQEKVGSCASVLSDGWNNIDKMRDVRCPLLLFHGERDTLIPVAHSHALFEAAVTRTKQLVTYPGYTHNELHWPDVFKRTRTFIAMIRAIRKDRF